MSKFHRSSRSVAVRTAIIASMIGLGLFFTVKGSANVSYTYLMPMALFFETTAEITAEKDLNNVRPLDANSSIKVHPPEGQSAMLVNRTWDGGGATNNWSEAANWSGDTVPGSGDLAVFDGTSTKNATIDAGFAGSVSGMQMGAGYTGTITQASGTSLSVSSGYSQAAGTFTGGNGSLTVFTSFSLSGGTLNAPSGTLTLHAINSGDPVTFGGGATFNHNNGTVAFTGSNANLTLPATLTFANVTINKGDGGQLGFSTASTLVVTGSLTLTDGTIANTGTIEAQGAVSIAPTFDGSNGSCTVLIDGAATRTVSLPVGAVIPALTVNAPNVTLNTSGAGIITFNRPLSVTSAALFANSAVNFVFNTPFTMTAAANFTPGSGDLTFNSSYTQTSGTFTPGSGVIRFNTIFALNGGTFNAPSSGTLTFNATNSGDPVTFGGGATFNHNNGTVAFIGGNANLTAPASLTFGNLTINKNGGGQLGFSTASTLVVTGALTLTDGNIANAPGTIEAQGAVSIASTFDGGSATLLISGSATRTVTWPVGAVVPALTVNAPNVTLNTSGAGTFTFDQPLTVTSAASFTNGSAHFTFNIPFTLTAAMNFTPGSGNLSFINTYTQTSGTFTPGSGAIHFDQTFSLTGGTFNAPSTGTLTFFLFNGESFTVNGGTFNHNNGTVAFTGGNFNLSVPATLTFGNFILNPSGGGQLGFLTASTLVIIGTLNLTDGSISGNGTIEAQGNVSIAPTFDGGTATLLIDGAAMRTVTWPVGAVVPGLTVNAPNVTLNTSGTGTFTFDQPLTVTSAAAFTNGAASFTFNIPFTLTAAMNFTPGSGNLTFINTYTQTSGTFTPGSGVIRFNTTFTLNGGTFNAPSSGTLTFHATNSGDGVTFGGGATFNHNNGTVAFTGSNANLTLPATLTFANVTLNRGNFGQFAFQTTSTMIVTGALTLTDGAISNASGVTGTIEAQGAVSIATTFDGGDVNMRFGGSADQAFTNSGGVNPTGNWTINKTAGTVTATTDLILGTSQALTITSGTLLLGSGSDLTCGVLTVSAAGKLASFSSTTATITLGGNPTNNGIVDLQGGGATCPDADTILLRSSVTNTRRNWSGTGRFRIVDVDLRDQGAPALTTIYSSNNTANNLNWTFDAGCPIPLSIAPTSVNLPAGGTQTFTANGTFTPRTFSIPVNNSGGSINSSSGLYTAGTAGVIDTVRVTNVFGDQADATVNVYTPIPSQLAFQTQPTNTTAGQAISPSVTVRVLDQFANFMPGATNAVTVAIGNNPGGSTLSGTLSPPTVSGVATFNNLSLNRTGTGYTLAATSGILTGATSTGFTITPAAPAQVVFAIQPSTAVAGVAISPAVQVAVQDTFGNLVNTATNSVTMTIANNPGSSTLTGTVPRNAASGVATFDDLKLNRVGTGYTLGASSGALTPATSTSFNINAGPPAAIGFVSQPPDTAPGVVMTPAVTVAVQDSQGNTVPGATNAITVAIENNPSAGTLTGTPTQNAVNGVATFNNLSINNAGVGYTLGATSGGLSPASSASFIIGLFVTNTNNSGTGSLRQAITNANAGTGTQLIQFAISGSPPFLIAPTTALPTITKTTTIDATTQPGYSGSPIVEIRGPGLGGNFYSGLKTTASGCIVQGLSITDFRQYGIEILSDGNAMRSNWIGISPDGNPSGSHYGGIQVAGNNNVVGGTTIADRNVIADNNGGIAVVGSNNIVQGNFIGTDPNGSSTSGFRNGFIGAYISGLGNSPSTLQHDNLIKDNVVTDILLTSYRGTVENNTIQNNIIGLDASGTIPMPSFGVYFVGAPKRIRITENRIFAPGRGILHTNNSSHRPNDPGDPDEGSNNYQNHPDLTSAISGGGNTTITGSLNSTPSSNFTLEFFSTSSCGPSDSRGQGETFLGSTNIATGASGIAGFTVNLPVSVTTGLSVSATATDASGNTSEFSRCRSVIPSYGISGTITDNSAVPLPNVSVKVTGSSTATVLTNSQGNYSFANLPAGGNYTVTPLLTNYVFSPLDRTYTNLAADQTNQNFSGARATLSISGDVYSRSVVFSGGSSTTTIGPLSGATVTLTGPVNATTTTNGNGKYSFSGLPAGNYTVTPTKASFTMTPQSASVTLSTNNVSPPPFMGQNPFSGRVVFIHNAVMKGMNADGSSIVTLLSGKNSSPSVDNTSQSKIVFSRLTGTTSNTGEIFTMNFDGTGLTRLTNNSLEDSSPIWLPVVGKIAFLRKSTPTISTYELFTMNLNGTNQVRVTAGVALTPTGFLNKIAFERAAGSNFSNIFTVNVDGTGLSQLTTDGASRFPVYSRDGSTIIFRRGNSNVLNLPIFKMNPDGSGQALLLAAPGGHTLNPETWSPDNTRFAFSDKTLSTGLNDIVSVAANGTDPVVMARSLNNSVPMPDWGYHYSASTGGFGPLGPSTVQLGGVTISFSGVSQNGDTTVTPIPPSSAGTLPAGFVIGDLAYDVTTDATFTPPVDVCFTVPDTEATTVTAFNRLYLMHSESGVLVDRTTTRDFGTRQICATTTSDLGAFALAEQIDNLLPMITGLVVDSDGNPMSDVTMNLTGEESRSAVTDSDGLFRFVNLTMNGNYNVQPNQIGYVFEEFSKDFLDITGEQTVVFTGTESYVTISGRVTDENGAGMIDIPISLNGSSTDQTVTDVNGDYTFLNVPAAGTYFVAPSHDELVFTPTEAIIENLVSDASGVDFSLSLPGTISGTVTYGNATLPPKYVSNVTVTGTGSTNVFTTTGAPGATAGQYTLTGFGTGSAYTVSLSKTTGQNSVTSNDAARIAQHVTGTNLLTNNNQKVAADVTGNNAISSQDAAKIAQVVAGLPFSPPNLTNTWRFFVPPGPTFPVGSSPTTRTYASVTSNVADEDYIGLLIGEVTGNWSPSAARPFMGNNGPERNVSVELPNVVVPVDKEIVVPVSIQGAPGQDIISYEFDLRYDPSVIQPLIDPVDITESVSQGLSFVVNAIQPGLIRVVVYGAMPIDRDGVLLNLRFTAVSPQGGKSPVSFERILFNEGDPGTTTTDGHVELLGAVPNKAAEDR